MYSITLWELSLVFFCIKCVLYYNIWKKKSYIFCVCLWCCCYAIIIHQIRCSCCVILKRGERGSILLYVKRIKSIERKISMKKGNNILLSFLFMSWDLFFTFFFSFLNHLRITFVCSWKLTHITDDIFYSVYSLYLMFIMKSYHIVIYVKKDSFPRLFYFAATGYQ